MLTSLRRTLAVGIAAAIALVTASLTAYAAPDQDAAAKAAAYLAAQIGDADHLTSEFGDEGITADATLALQAVDGSQYRATVDRLVGYLKAQAPGYVASSPEGAAKLALVAVAVGEDARDFGGVDLVKAVTEGIKDDGSFGSYPGPFAQSLGIMALRRAGEPVPEAMITWLVAQQDTATGGFGYEIGQPADADNTGMALMALTAVTSDGGAAAKQAATDWATKNQSPDGSWAGYSPVNSTAVMGMALEETGADVAGAVAWTADQQQEDGGLPVSGTSDLLATAQGALLLSGASYLSISPAGLPVGDLGGGRGGPDRCRRGGRGRRVATEEGPGVTRRRTWLAVGLATLALAGVVASPGQAAPASGSCDGVWVVVDPGTRGEVSISCAARFDSGRTALESAGFRLELRDGMICRIDAVPDTCTLSMTDYWSYWHATRRADGSLSEWTYSTLGAASYTPRRGDVEGWFFGEGGRVPPSQLPAGYRSEGPSQPSQSAASPQTPQTQTPSPQLPVESSSPQGTLAAMAILLLAAPALGWWWLRRRRRP